LDNSYGRVDVFLYGLPIREQKKLALGTDPAARFMPSGQEKKL
jgi:hypothetical protein